MMFLGRGREEEGMPKPPPPTLKSLRAGRDAKNAYASSSSPLLRQKIGKKEDGTSFPSLRTHTPLRGPSTHKWDFFGSCCCMLYAVER